MNQNQSLIPTPHSRTGTRTGYLKKGAHLMLKSSGILVEYFKSKMKIYNKYNINKKYFYLLGIWFLLAIFRIFSIKNISWIWKHHGMGTIGTNTRIMLESELL